MDEKQTSYDRFPYHASLVYLQGEAERVILISQRVSDMILGRENATIYDSFGALVKKVGESVIEGQQSLVGASVTSLLSSTPEKIEQAARSARINFDEMVCGVLFHEESQPPIEGTEGEVLEAVERRIPDMFVRAVVRLDEALERISVGREAVIKGRYSAYAPWGPVDSSQLAQEVTGAIGRAIEEQTERQVAGLDIQSEASISANTQEGTPSLAIIMEEFPIEIKVRLDQILTYVEEIYSLFFDGESLTKDNTDN